MSERNEKGKVVEYDPNTGFGSVEVKGEQRPFVSGSFLPGAGRPQPRVGDEVSVSFDANGNVIAIAADNPGWVTPKQLGKRP